MTARFDALNAQHFQALRDRYFPPKLNIVPAHLTLFHKLPGSDFPAIDAALAAEAGALEAIPFRVTGLRFLGRGVAYAIEAPHLCALRERLAVAWRSWLSPQDAQAFRPHVTVQNKSNPAEAKALHASLMAAFQAFDGTVVGLDLWHYRDGPWQHAGLHSFSRRDPGPT